MSVVKKVHEILKKKRFQEMDCFEPGPRFLNAIPYITFAWGFPVEEGQIRPAETKEWVKAWGRCLAIEKKRGNRVIVWRARPELAVYKDRTHLLWRCCFIDRLVEEKK